MEWYTIDRNVTVTCGSIERGGEDIQARRAIHPIVSLVSYLLHASLLWNKRSDRAGVLRSNLSSLNIWVSKSIQLTLGKYFVQVEKINYDSSMLRDPDVTEFRIK
ncbi:hypothetical protein WAI453_013036 [Rhynchosporium graminicola]